MKNHALLAILAAAALGLTTSRMPAQTAEPGDNPAHWRKAADNRIYAQQLVNEVMAKHKDLKVVGIHLTPPGTKQQQLVACNLDRINKWDDDDDKAIVEAHQIILGPNLKDPTKYEVLIPLKDKAGNQIGALGLVFNYHAGESELKMHEKATVIRDDIAAKTGSLDALLKPVE